MNLVYVEPTFNGGHSTVIIDEEDVIKHEKKMSPRNINASDALVNFMANNCACFAQESNIAHRVLDIHQRIVKQSIAYSDKYPEFEVKTLPIRITQHNQLCFTVGVVNDKGIWIESTSLYTGVEI